MRIMKRALVAVAASCALIAMVLAALLQLARPDLLHMLLGGPFGSARAAIAWLYIIGIGITVIVLRTQAKRWIRVIVGSSVIVACVLALMHAVGFDWNYTITEVEYASQDGTPLEASLYLPTQAGRHPAVVIVHGSAAMRRGVYEVLAEPFVRNGYAVLLADKRGVGGSGGTFDTQNNVGPANITRLTADVVAGVQFLAGHPAIQADSIGLVGISQAGWVAPLAATQNSRVKFLVMITAPTVSSREENAWSELRGDHSGDTTMSLSAAEAIVDTVSSGGVDARVPLGALRIPGLFLFGSRDNSVPSRKSIRVLDSLNAAGGRYSHRLYEGYDHALIGRSGAVVPRMAPEFRDDLVRWLRGSHMKPEF